jgi:hypothetical protein
MVIAAAAVRRSPAISAPCSQRRDPSLVVGELALGAVQHHAVDQPDDAAMLGIDRQHLQRPQQFNCNTRSNALFY